MTKSFGRIFAIVISLAVAAVVFLCLFGVTGGEALAWAADDESIESTVIEEEIEGGEQEDIRSEMVEKVECEHAEILVEGTFLPSTLVEVTVYDFEQGYALDYVLVSSNGRTVITERSGNKYSFYMPADKIAIKVVFKESVPVEGKKVVFGTKEIIAVSVAGGILLVGGVVIIVKNKRKEK